MNDDFKKGCCSTIRILCFSLLWWLVFMIWGFNMNFENNYENIIFCVVFLISLFSPLIIYYIEKKIIRTIQIKKNTVSKSKIDSEVPSVKAENEQEENAIDNNEIKQEQIILPENTQSKTPVEETTTRKIIDVENEDNYLKDYKYKYKLSTDPFSKEIEIQWFKLGSYGRGVEERKEDLGCPLSVHAYECNDKICWFSSTDALHFHLRIQAPQLGIRYDKTEVFLPHKLAKGDTLSFLFDDNSILKYVLNNAPNNIGGDINSYCKKKHKEIRFELTNYDAQKFATQTITHYRLDCANGDASQIVEVKYNDRSQIIRHHFQVYLNILEECNKSLCDINTEAENVSIDTKSEPCYVYLMYDESNGYYKIGISNNPEYREHTLQSEKPTIVLVQAKQFPIRSIAEAFEAALHKTYEGKRLRGEWFKLDTEDANNIKNALL